MHQPVETGELSNRPRLHYIVAGNLDAAAETAKAWGWTQPGPWRFERSDGVSVHYSPSIRHVTLAPPASVIYLGKLARRRPDYAKLRAELHDRGFEVCHSPLSDPDPEEDS